MATRHVRSVKAIEAGIGEINALLAKMTRPGKVKWGGYGTHADWFVRKLKETSAWESGQLGTRTFEEKDPMDDPTLPFCYISETYGVSEKSIKSNRAAGQMKLYDIQKENARNAQNALYRALAAACYSNGSDAQEPVGLAAIVADCYETTDNVTTIATAKTYAGIGLADASMSAYSANYATQGWTNEYWHPVALDQGECPVKSGTAAWSTDAVKDLAWMEHAMMRTADVSGTGEIIKPDMALMNTDPWAALMALLATSQTTYNVPVGTTDPVLAKFNSIRVGNLDVIYDENVPDDSGSVERVFVLDSDAFYIHTQNTKSEGLVEGQWKQDDPEVVGGVGVYKSNLALICKTPQAVGVFTGCNG
jgi:hypothetical protein